MMSLYEQHLCMILNVLIKLNKLLLWWGKTWPWPLVGTDLAPAPGGYRPGPGPWWVQIWSWPLVGTDLALAPFGYRPGPGTWWVQTWHWPLVGTDLALVTG